MNHTKYSFSKLPIVVFVAVLMFASMAVPVNSNIAYAVAAQCQDNIDNDGDGLADMLDTGCSGISDNDESNTPLACSPQKIWQLGVFDYLSGNDTEFPKTGGYTPTFNYSIIGTGSATPQIPGFLNDKLVPTTVPEMVTKTLNLQFSLPQNLTNASVVWGKYGSETNTLLLDGQTVRTVTGPGESLGDAIRESVSLSAGSHTFTIRYDNGGINQGNYLDAIALVGCVAPVTVTCNTNSDCGTNGLTGGPFCQGNGVYKNYITYTCNNPGTSNSTCSNSTSAQLQQTCSASQTCSSGTCVSQIQPLCSDGIDNDSDGAVDYPSDFSCGSASDNDETNPKAQCQDGVDNDGDGLIDYPQDLGCTSKQDNNEFNASITCNTSSDCGTNGLTGGPFCQGNGVYKNYITYTCNNPGTSNSTCSNSTSAQLQQTCTNNQTCSSGSCSNVNITCNTNSDCGASGLTGGNFCQGNGVYRNFTTYTCNNPGTSNSTCTNSTSAQLQQTCSTGQTCSGNSCTTITSTCTNHASQRCTGNAVYWFDSCGNQQDLYQICASGQLCSNNTCINQQTSSVLNKTGRNLSSGNLNWSTSVYASPSDVLQFQVTIQAPSNQLLNNVIVKDTFPANLINYNALTVDGVANSGNITSGINIGTISAGQSRIITYQAQVAPTHNFSFGTTTLTNSVTISGTGLVYNPPLASASIVVTKTGATIISTGLTNNFLTDSFFLPLLLALLALWAYKSRLIALPSWVGTKKLNNHNLAIEKELKSTIDQIKKRELA